MTDIAVDIAGVSKSFGTTRAVRDLHLQVPVGSICGFLGPNGAGKSTTIRMIMSIIYPDTGSIQVLGGDALANKDQIGYLPEERGVYRKMKVVDFLKYIARLKGVDPKNLDKRIDDWLDRIDLPEAKTRKCEELSKGQQQKIQFLVAIIHQPKLLILDEPFSGLDPVNAEMLNRMIMELHARGTTIIFSTHVLFQAEQICDRIFLIHRGEKLLDATLDEIREQFDPRTILAEPLNGTVPELGAIPGVRNVRSQADSPALELDLDPNGDPQRVMEAVLRTGPMRRVELRRLSLEEVFVRLVMRDAGEEEAARAREELSHG